MPVARRIVVVDDDPRIHQLFEHFLGPPEYRLYGFVDPCVALMGLQEIAPDLILCDIVMPGLDGRTLYRTVKSSPRLAQVPFIFLSGDRVHENELRALMSPQDDLLFKPVAIHRVLERIQAAIGISARPAAVKARQQPLSGEVTRGGILTLLQFCEDERLTGRFKIESLGEMYWVEFLNGEVVRSGTIPETPGADPIDQLLASDGGTYTIEQRPVDPGARRTDSPEAHPAQGASVPDGSAVPVGRFSIVEVGGESLLVQTEAEHGPQFTVITVVAQAGQGLRKFASSWPHPLKREGDYTRARREIEEQHERIMAMVRDEGIELPRNRPIWGLEGASVEGQLLCWALSLVAEQARPYLGRVTTVALLRRTLRRDSRHKDTLACFRVTDEGAVVLHEPSSSARTTFAGKSLLPPDAVEAVAVWAVVFLNEAAQIVPEAGTVDVPQVTRMMRSELASVGFYASVEAAARDAARPSAAGRDTRQLG